MCVPCWVFAQRTQQDLVFFCFLSAIPSQLWLVGGNAKKPSACNGPAHRALECAALLSCFCLSFSAYPRAALCWQINNFSNCSFNSLFSLCSTLELANFSIALPNISLCWKNPGHVENFLSKKSVGIQNYESRTQLVLHDSSLIMDMSPRKIWHTGQK